MNAWNGAVATADAQFEAKRQAILREAAASFNRKGYHGTSLTEIAETLGVSKAALYTYVKSKDELLYFCHDVAMDAAIESLRLARAEGGSGLRQLCATLRHYLMRILSNEACYVVLLEEHALRPEHVSAIIRRRDRFEAELRSLVASGIVDGSVVPCNPKLAIFSALGMINWVQKWYAPGGSWSGEQIAVGMVQFLERMLARTPSPALTVEPALLPGLFALPASMTAPTVDPAVDPRAPD